MLGTGFADAVARIIYVPFVVPVVSALIAFLASVGIGVVFGVLPAEGSQVASPRCASSRVRPKPAAQDAGPVVVPTMASTTRTWARWSRSP